MAYGDSGIFLQHLTRLLLETRWDKKLHEVLRPRIGAAAYIKIGRKKVVGSRVRLDVETVPYTGARMGLMEAALPDSYKIDARQVYIAVGTSNKLAALADTSNSDIRRLAAALKVTEESLLACEGEGGIVELADKLIQGVKDDMTEAKRAKFWQGSGAEMCRIKLDSTVTETDGTTLLTTSTAAKVQIDPAYGSVSQLLEGMIVDLYTTSGTRHFANATIQDVIPSTTEKGVWYVNIDLSTCATDGTGTVTDGTVTDTDYLDGRLSSALCIYRNGEYGKGVHGMKDWFNLTAAGGSDTIFSVDRSAAGYSWFMPTKWGNSSLSDLSMSLFDGLWPIVRRLGGPKVAKGLTLIGDLEMMENVKRELLEDKQSIFPMDEATSKLYGADGLTDMYILTPNCGKVALVSDEMAPADQMKILAPDTWFWLALGEDDEGDLNWARDGERGGIWHMAKDTTTAYLCWRAWAYMFTQLACTAPRRNFEVYNVRSTNAA